MQTLYVNPLHPWKDSSSKVYLVDIHGKVVLDFGEKQDVFAHGHISETQMLPIMANSKDGQDHKDKYLDTRRNIS